VDEKIAIQALDQAGLVLRLSPGRAERHEFECYPSGTRSLYRALDVPSGKVQGKIARSHTSEDFIAFVSEVVERNPAPREIYIVLDNLSAHKTQTLKNFLATNPRVRFTSCPPTPRGSIRSKSGLPASSVT
jgi:hypothetical protein